MASSQRTLRLTYGRLEEPADGWVLIRCDALDLVSQGRTEVEACETLREEAALCLSHARDAGTLDSLLERLNARAAGGADTAFELNLSQLP